MSALGTYIERAGVATVSISLIREQTAKVGTPRALWVPFALGRPLGSAADPEYQKSVMRAAFDLLETATEPTIGEWTAAPPDEAVPEQWACPVNLGPRESTTITGALVAEVARLKPWAAETRRERGRTLFGVTGANVDQVDDVVQALGHIAESGDLSSPPPGDVEWRFAMPLLIRHLADDLRTVYHEALTGQPGATAPNHDALNAWIFGGTALGDTLHAIADQLTAAATPFTDLVRGLLIPEGHYKGGSAFGKIGGELKGQQT